MKTSIYITTISKFLHYMLGPKKLRFYEDYSLSGCKLELLTLRAVKECGCRAMHMPWDKNGSNPPPYCNLTTLDTCIRRVKGK